MRRHIKRADDVGRKHTPERFKQRHIAGVLHGNDKLGEEAQHVISGQRLRVVASQFGRDLRQCFHDKRDSS